MIKKILITGASSGVGRSLANLFYKKGFELILISRRIEFAAEDFHGSPNVTAYSIDLGDAGTATEKLNEVLNVHGYIPYAINNAGVLVTGTLDQVSWQNFEKAININARMPLFIMQKLLPEMRKNNFGRIINITSGAPLNCFPNVGVYSGSKALLNATTVTMARENSEFNIKINLMSPGPVRSEMSPNAELLPDICHPTVEYLINAPAASNTGKFYWLGYEVPLFPDLEGVQWLKGIGNEKLTKIL
jgi:short-subunit dehydrogenase